MTLFTLKKYLPYYLFKTKMYLIEFVYTKFTTENDKNMFRPKDTELHWYDNGRTEFQPLNSNQTMI